MEKLDLKNPNNCRCCGKPHNLKDKDAGSTREIERLCQGCYNQLKDYLPQVTNCNLKRQPKHCSIVQNTSFKTCEGCGHYIKTKS